MAMKLVPDIVWRSAGPGSKTLDARLLPLLREIRVRATLRAAVGTVGLSYRSAWDLLNAQTRELGAPLVRMQRGRGATLTPLGEQLVAADDDARRRLDDACATLSVRIDRAAAPRLRCVASHDLLLSEFVAEAARDCTLEFRGSLESVTAFSRGEADLAGFHVFSGDAEAFERLLQPRRDRVIRFARREQGLLLPPGNPRRLRTLGDVARKKARFINRQRGSGTRFLIDDLLREEGIPAKDIVGYGNEEFTHLAVAATIASGRADAGVGVRAAADRFGLAFVPLRSERYWLAVRQRKVGEPGIRRMVAAMRGTTLPRLAKALAGYDVAAAGEILPVSALWSEA